MILFMSNSLLGRFYAFGTREILPIIVKEKELFSIHEAVFSAFKNP